MHIGGVRPLLLLRAHWDVAAVLLQDVVIVLVLIFGQASRGAIRGCAALRDWNAARDVVTSQSCIVDGTTAVAALASMSTLGYPYASVLPTPRVLRTTIDAD